MGSEEKRTRKFFRWRRGEMVYVRGNFCGKGWPCSRAPPTQVTKLCGDSPEGRNFQIQRQKPTSFILVHNIFTSFPSSLSAFSLNRRVKLSSFIRERRSKKNISQHSHFASKQQQQNMCSHTNEPILLLTSCVFRYDFIFGCMVRFFLDFLRFSPRKYKFLSLNILKNLKFQVHENGQEKAIIHLNYVLPFPMYYS